MGSGNSTRLCHSDLSSQRAQVGYDRTRGLGFSVAMDLKVHLTSCILRTFFTGLPLLKELADDGMGAIGKVRSNRVENCPGKVQELPKKQRSTFGIIYNFFQSIET